MILVNPDKVYFATDILLCIPYNNVLRSRIVKQIDFVIHFRVVYVRRKILCVTVFRQSSPLGGVFGF